MNLCHIFALYKGGGAIVGTGRGRFGQGLPVEDKVGQGQVVQVVWDCAHTRARANVSEVVVLTAHGAPYMSVSVSVCVCMCVSVSACVCVCERERERERERACVRACVRACACA